MKYYVGIDLGTTNSAICSYDGITVRTFKSPEQNDVTPSAIFFDRRGNKYLGRNAYENGAKNPGSSAIKFKRLMGTSTPIQLPDVNMILSPEQCSAEILKLCYGYLPEEIRNSGETGTVITVPAAFNQMQRDATMTAAELAGIEPIALMQEPVAAVMSAARFHKEDGIFLIYDLGGGTLDIAIAENTSGHVNLLSHGGIAMCGGTDFDRLIFDNIVKPWLFDNYTLPKDFTINKKYKPLIHMSLLALEKAKIHLSSSNESVIMLTEFEHGTKDENGKDIYVDIPFVRSEFDELIENRIMDSIFAARETIEKAGLSHQQVSRIVFIGGPTNYKPLRDKVVFELGIEPSFDINPMTSVAEGACIFAESISWDSKARGRKSSRGSIQAQGIKGLSFDYIARTPEFRSKIVVKWLEGEKPGFEFQIDSSDTGWTSGRKKLTDGMVVDITLSTPGDNIFKVFVFDQYGSPVMIENSKIIISKTSASIDAIPSSSSIGIQVDNEGRQELEYIVRKGDPLPVKGSKTFKAAEILKAGSTNSLNFILREGDIEDEIHDNECIGSFEIKGTDFDSDMILKGDKLVFDYEILDSGQIFASITVGRINSVFKCHNFYSPNAGRIDYTRASKQIDEDITLLTQRVDSISSRINDNRLEEVSNKIQLASTKENDVVDGEVAKQSMDYLKEAKKILALIRKDNKKSIRQLDLDSCLKYFNNQIRKLSRPSEVTSFENLAKTAQRSIDQNTSSFEDYLQQMKSRNFEVLWRQDWFVVDLFKDIIKDVWFFTDKQKFQELTSVGEKALADDNVSKLRSVIAELYSIRISSSTGEDLLVNSNIMRG